MGARYLALIHRDADSDFGISFPDFPGCISAGDTLDDALSMGAEALALHLDGMREDGDAIPEPGRVHAVGDTVEGLVAVGWVEAD